LRAPSPPPPPSPSPPLGLLLSLCAGILLTCLVFSYLYISLWRGDHDGLNHAVGRDFINLWTASELVDAGRTADIFDQDKFAAAQRQHMGADFPFHFWSYPPQALFLTEQLSSLPYRVAFLTWTLCGLLVLFYAAQKFWPAMKSFPWLLLLAPSTFVNVFLGQNGFITTTLAIAGFTMLDRRPILSGIMFGLLTFKPHLGILIPVSLLAMRQWKAIAAATVTAVLLAGATTLMYGEAVWWQFLDSTLPHQLRFMSTSEGPFRWMMPGWFMAGRIIGLPLWLAHTVQTIVAIGAVILVYRVFRAGPGGQGGLRGLRDWRLRVSLLFVATFAASPQGFNYDMGLISIPLICLSVDAMKTGWRRGEFITVAFCWTLPVLMMPLNAHGLPIGPLLLAGLLAYLYYRIQVTIEPDRQVLQHGVA